MTVCGSWCYRAVIRDCDPAWEDFPDDGSECAVARPWHTCFLRFDVPGDDYSSTACIASNAASRRCAVRGGEPGGGLVVFGGVRRPYRAAAGTFRREILAATRASNSFSDSTQIVHNCKTQYAK